MLLDFQIRNRHLAIRDRTCNAATQSLRVGLDVATFVEITAQVTLYQFSYPTLDIFYQFRHFIVVNVPLIIHVHVIVDLSKEIKIWFEFDTCLVAILHASNFLLEVLLGLDQVRSRLIWHLILLIRNIL